MKSYICPECGSEIVDQFFVSIGGLFLSDQEEINPFSVYAFLNDEVVLNDEAFESEGFSILRDFRTFYSGVCKNERNRRNQNSSAENEEDSNEFGLEFIKEIAEKSKLDDKILNNVDEYIRILENADVNYICPVLKYDLDPAENVYSEECVKYVWAYIMVRKIKEALNNYNRIIRYLLSVDISEYNDFSDIKWCEVDLLDCFAEDKYANLLKNMTFIVETTRRQNDTKEAMQIISMIKTVDKCQLKLFKEWCRPTTETADDGKSYLVNFQYGKNRGHIRVCPKCGAHIASRLGLYEQKIISLIGMPASGKSTLINSIYASLRGEEAGKYRIDSNFDVCEPMYNYYKGNFDNASLYGLSVEKTELGQYPSLSICLEKNRKKYIYSFVDVPGEYFKASSADDAFNNVDMFHLSVMKHSDVLCLIIAGEQLIPPVERNQNISTMAMNDRQALDNFITRVGVFKSSVLEGNPNNIPVFLVVTKPDAIKPGENDYNTINEGTDDEKKIWQPSFNDDVQEDGAANAVSYTEINELYSYLNKSNLFFDNSSIIDLENLLEIQRLSHKFILGVDNTKNFISRLVSSLRGSVVIEKTPIFMVSAFGYYAANGVWQISKEEKIDALKNQASLRELSEAELEILVSGTDADYTDDISEKNADNDEIDSFDIDIDESSSEKIHRIQRKYDLKKTDIEKIILDYYKERHSSDRPFGLNSFLSWVLVYTGLIDYAIGQDNIAEGRERQRRLFSYFRGKLRTYDGVDVWRVRIKNALELEKITHQLESKMERKVALESRLNNLSKQYGTLGIFHKKSKTGKSLKKEMLDIEKELEIVKSECNKLDDERKHIEYQVNKDKNSID